MLLVVVAQLAERRPVEANVGGSNPLDHPSKSLGLDNNKKNTEIFFPLVGKPLLKFLYKKYNKEIKALLKDEVEDNKLFVFGHTHWAEVDSKYNLIVTGIVQYGFGQYLIIDENGFQAKEYLYNK